VRVALVSYYYPEYVISLANALASKGVRLLLLVPRQSVESISQNLVPDIEFRPFEGRRLRDPLSIAEVWRNVQAIRTWRPDLIHLQQGHLWFNLAGLPLLGRSPLVTTIHDVTIHHGDLYSRRTPQWVWDLAARRASHLIVHGQALKTEAAQRHGFAPDRIHVIPHGEFGFYTQWGQDDRSEKDDILFFGRIWPYKGLQYLIQAEPLITAQIPTARIVIAGEGESLEPYEQMMANRDRFVVHNRYIPVEEVGCFFEQAALVVLPYVEASQSGVIPLAYAFGKPVVATSVGSIPEVVDHGETGYLVPPRDVPKLAEAVVGLLKDDTLRRQMGRNAYQKAVTELSWERIAEQVVAVYDAALAA
jgi:glycosyltransferase involved in cell wall biosynthesis